MNEFVKKVKDHPAAAVAGWLASACTLAGAGIAAAQSVGPLLAVALVGPPAGAAAAAWWLRRRSREREANPLRWDSCELTYVFSQPKGARTQKTVRLLATARKKLGKEEGFIYAKRATDGASVTSGISLRSFPRGSDSLPGFISLDPERHIHEERMAGGRVAVRIVPGRLIPAGHQIEIVWKEMLENAFPNEQEESVAKNMVFPAEKVSFDLTFGRECHPKNLRWEVEDITRTIDAGDLSPAYEKDGRARVQWAASQPPQGGRAVIRWTWDNGKSE